jgi:hypothetical protein
MGSTARSPRVRARVTPHRGQGGSLVRAPLYTRKLSLSQKVRKLSTRRPENVESEQGRASNALTYSGCISAWYSGASSACAAASTIFPHGRRIPGIAKSSAVQQGLTLVHFSAQLKRFLRDRGGIGVTFEDCLGGCFAGAREVSGGVGGCKGCISCQIRLRLS